MKERPFMVRKVFDTLFHCSGIGTLAILGICLVLLLGPILYKGIQAVVFCGTIEHRKVLVEQFNFPITKQYEKDCTTSQIARQEIQNFLQNQEQWIQQQSIRKRRSLTFDLQEVKSILSELVGPLHGEEKPILVREQYGANRWELVEQQMHHLLFLEEWIDVTDEHGKIIDRRLQRSPRCQLFKEMPLYPLFDYMENNLEEIMVPRWTCFWQFFTLPSKDSHIYGGIWAEILGTIYLTAGAMLIAIPIGLISAIYLAEYAADSLIVQFLRSCISTLAGVPSIVFGLFGLAFFINTLHLSNSKSTFIGSLTLSLLILPTIIRASEEAIKSIPKTYKEAALALGANRWKMIYSVLLPAALPGILTGIIISMGRAAGETAPIMFTAAVSVGKPLAIWQIFTEPTPALPWNIYNLATEHEAMDRIAHVQFGMVTTLIAIVFILNLAAIIIRGRMMNKQR